MRKYMGIAQVDGCSPPKSGHLVVISPCDYPSDDWNHIQSFKNVHPHGPIKHLCKKSGSESFTTWLVCPPLPPFAPFTTLCAPLHFRLGYRVPTTPLPLYFKLGFRVHTTSLLPFSPFILD